MHALKATPEWSNTFQASHQSYYESLILVPYATGSKFPPTRRRVIRQTNPKRSSPLMPDNITFPERLLERKSLQSALQHSLRNSSSTVSLRRPSASSQEFNLGKATLIFLHTGFLVNDLLMNTSLSQANDLSSQVSPRFYRNAAIESRSVFALLLLPVLPTNFDLIGDQDQTTRMRIGISLQ